MGPTVRGVRRASRRDAAVGTASSSAMPTTTSCEMAIPVAMSGRAVAAGSALHDALVARIEADAAIELLDSAGTPLDGALRLAIDGEVHPYGDAITRWRRPE